MAIFEGSDKPQEFLNSGFCQTSDTEFSVAHRFPFVTCPVLICFTALCFMENRTSRLKEARQSRPLDLQTEVLQNAFVTAKACRVIGSG